MARVRKLGLMSVNSRLSALGTSESLVLRLCLEDLPHLPTSSSHYIAVSDNLCCMSFFITYLADQLCETDY